MEQFCEAFFVKSKSNAALANICKPAVDRWQKRYKSAVDAYKQAKEMFDRTKKTADAVLNELFITDNLTEKRLGQLRLNWYAG